MLVGTGRNKIMEFRFVFCPAVGLTQEPFYGTSVASKGLAQDQLNVIAEYTLHLHKTNVMQDYSNCGYIEAFDGEDWTEIEEDECECDALGSECPTCEQV